MNRFLHVLSATVFTLTISAGAYAQPAALKPSPADAPPGPFEEQSIPTLEQNMKAGTVTSEELVTTQLARIKAIDSSGPSVHSMTTLNPNALADAKALDADRRAGRIRGPLHGVTVAVKDLIDIRGIPTTAGSLALLENIPAQDSPAVARLRAAGAVIIGHSNTAEWANARSPGTLQSWSAVGGFTRNPYALNRTASGSSSGSGASVAAGLVTAAIGTDTSGSVISPSQVNGLVGMRPTVGLIPRTGVIPFSYRSDTIGPMGRTVVDVATLLTVMAGSDAGDPLSADADKHKTNYVAALKPDALKGLRLGVLRLPSTGTPMVDDIFEQSLQALRDQGAVLVDITDAPPPPTADQMQAMAAPGGRGESHYTYDQFLSHTAPAVKVRSLAELVAFNRDHAQQELPLFGQEVLEGALASPATAPTDETNKRSDARRQFARDQIDALLKSNSVMALIAPTGAPATILDVITNNSRAGAARPSRTPTPAGTTAAASAYMGGVLNPGQFTLSTAAIAAYPHLTVPMGYYKGMPVGLSFIGTAWSEQHLLAYGYVFEQATHVRRPPTFPASIEETPEIKAELGPQKLPPGQ